MMLTAFAGCGSSAAPAGESSVSAALASAEDAAEAGNGTAESPEAAASPEEPAVAESAEAGEASNGEAETAEFEGNPPIEYPLVDELYTISYMQAWPPFLNEISIMVPQSRKSVPPSACFQQNFLVLRLRLLESSFSAWRRTVDINGNTG